MKDETKIAFAAVGFTFHKFFPGHGWFEGRVNEIRSKAAHYKTRRIIYSDGDSEDLSVKEIRKCVDAYKKYQSSQEKASGNKSGTACKNTPQSETSNKSGTESKKTPQPETVNKSGAASKKKHQTEPANKSGTENKNTPQPETVNKSGTVSKKKPQTEPANKSGTACKNTPQPETVNKSGTEREKTPQLEPAKKESSLRINFSLKRKRNITEEGVKKIADKASSVSKKRKSLRVTTSELEKNSSPRNQTSAKSTLSVDNEIRKTSAVVSKIHFQRGEKGNKINSVMPQKITPQKVQKASSQIAEKTPSSFELIRQKVLADRLQRRKDKIMMKRKAKRTTSPSSKYTVALETSTGVNNENEGKGRTEPSLQIDLTIGRKKKETKRYSKPQADTKQKPSGHSKESKKWKNEEERAAPELKLDSNSSSPHKKAESDPISLSKKQEKSKHLDSQIESTSAGNCVSLENSKRRKTENERTDPELKLDSNSSSPRNKPDASMPPSHPIALITNTFTHIRDKAESVLSAAVGGFAGNSQDETTNLSTDDREKVRNSNVEGGHRILPHQASLSTKYECRDIAESVPPPEIKEVPSGKTDSLLSNSFTEDKKADKSIENCDVIRRSNRNRVAMSSCEESKFGEIGFIFSKYFPGHGFFRGMVVEIVKGGWRRCAYSDGDQEDLSLSELRRIVRIEMERSPKTQNASTEIDASIPFCSMTQPMAAPLLPVASKKIDGKLSQVDIHSNQTMIESSYASSGLDFDMADDIIPLDATAESTLQLDHQSKGHRKNEDSEDHDEESAWLKKVATLVNAKAKKKNNKILVNGSEIFQSNDSEASGNEDTTWKAVPLVQVRKEQRHGCKVVNIKDKNHVVGQLLIENSGWAEVVVGGETKKDRTSNFVVVPARYSIGDNITDLNIIAPKSKKAEAPIHKDKLFQVSDKRILSKSIFYWYCEHCKIANDLVCSSCKGCDRLRKSISSSPSALLEVVENVCIAYGRSGAADGIPLLHRKSIPPGVVEIVLDQMYADEGSARKTFDLESPLTPDSLFYWQCSQCTFNNSFRRWTCTTCKRKKNDESPQSVLMKIASDASKGQLQVHDALNAVPDIHKCAIPEVVLRSLVTCIAYVKRNNRRCLCPKVAGSDYCSSHQSAIKVGINSDTLSSGAYIKKCAKKKSDAKQQGAFTSINQLIANIRCALRDTVSEQKNYRNWRIKCIEDAFVCERNEPFPLGLIVRRFFPGHGYHDGFITNVTRKEVEENNDSRPVLIYRIKYNDGDEEDMLHHEVNSLRQLYNVRYVKATAPSHHQVKFGSLFKTLNGMVEIVSIETNEADPSDNGTIIANVEVPNQPKKIVEIELMKFQKFVVHKISDEPRPRKAPKHWLLDDTRSTGNKFSQGGRLPFIEWPPQNLKGGGDSTLSDDDEMITLCHSSGLRLHRKCQQEVDPNSKSISPAKEIARPEVHRIVDDEICHSRRGVIQSGYDPAGVRNFISYNPYESTKCEICKSGEEDHYLLICDDCDRGFHTYCLRPVVVNIPREDWSCPECSTGRNIFKSFEDLAQDFRQSPAAVLSFLKLPFQSTEEFYSSHSEAFGLLRARQQWRSRFSKLRTSEKVGGIHISRNKDKHLFLLPEPIEDPDLFLRSLASIAAALNYCGMENYSESLAYAEKVPESMNNAAIDMDTVTTLSKKNLELFELYKENLAQGVYPPVEVVYSSSIGFVVKALAKMKRHTIVTEYVGEITTIDQTGNTSSDSLMNILQTGDDSTSLIIDPSRTGNMARFFSGINNRNLWSKKKANIRTRRFVVDGKCRVVLFTAKDVQAGDILHYDYNAGIEGKSVEAMVRSGFYDTSNFL